MEAKLRHDFINNCLRIEILQKLMIEDLEAGRPVRQEHLEDYKEFLEEQIGHCSSGLN